jgi:DNA-binding NtrC family response regulator
MLRTRIAIDQLSRRSRAPVLLVGEFGTGKRHCARALHAATFPEGEFFELHDAKQLGELERRMAGLRKLASSQSAVGLTVYVHELADLPAPIQVHLSKLLSEQGLHFRLIASSSRPLAQAAREGLVRSELAFRFPNQLLLPPLRERTADIPELARHFSELSASRRGSLPTRFGESALERLQEHDWAGNLAELETLVERLSQSFGPVLLEAPDLPALDERPSGVDFHLPATGIDFAQLERELITQALALAGNNQTRAASLLGLTRDQLRYRLAKFEIPAASGRG